MRFQEERGLGLAFHSTPPIYNMFILSYFNKLMLNVLGITCFFELVYREKSYGGAPEGIFWPETFDPAIWVRGLGAGIFLLIVFVFYS